MPPLPHLLPVDTTLHWARGRQPALSGSGVPVVTHLHGGHNRFGERWPAGSLVHPRLRPDGPALQREYTYDNDQEAATLWYHDHALGVTRLNVYAGLAGFYIVRDENEDGLGDSPLPAGPYEMPMAIQDRMFMPRPAAVPGRARGARRAARTAVLPEFFGDIILVNGKAWPYLDVEPRQYRFRVLNGSDSRFYSLYPRSGQPFHQIGTDDGLLDPVPMNRSIGPGERHDIIVDFSSAALRARRLTPNRLARRSPRATSRIRGPSARSWRSTSSSPSTKTSTRPRSAVRPPARQWPHRPLPAAVTDPATPALRERGRAGPDPAATRNGRGRRPALDDEITENPGLGDTEVLGDPQHYRMPIRSTCTRSPSGS